jgi:hypothetical protein
VDCAKPAPPEAPLEKAVGRGFIFYYRSSEGIIYLLTIYDKSSQSDLSAADKKALRKIVETLRVLE